MRRSGSRGFQRYVFPFGGSFFREAFLFLGLTGVRTLVVTLAELPVGTSLQTSASFSTRGIPSSSLRIAFIVAGCFFWGDFYWALIWAFTGAGGAKEFRRVGSFFGRVSKGGSTCLPRGQRRPLPTRPYSSSSMSTTG